MEGLNGQGFRAGHRQSFEPTAGQVQTAKEHPIQRQQAPQHHKDGRGGLVDADVSTGLLPNLKEQRDEAFHATSADGRTMRYAGNTSEYGRSCKLGKVLWPVEGEGRDA